MRCAGCFRGRGERASRVNLSMERVSRTNRHLCASLIELSVCSRCDRSMQSQWHPVHTLPLGAAGAGVESRLQGTRARESAPHVRVNSPLCPSSRTRPSRSPHAPQVPPARVRLRFPLRRRLRARPSPGQRGREADRARQVGQPGDGAPRPPRQPHRTAPDRLRQLPERLRLGARRVRVLRPEELPPRAVGRVPGRLQPRSVVRAHARARTAGAALRHQRLDCGHSRPDTRIRPARAGERGGARGPARQAQGRVDPGAELREPPGRPRQHPAPGGERGCERRHGARGLGPRGRRGPRVPRRAAEGL